MGRRVIGLDITEEQLTAVVVEQKSGQFEIVAHGVVALNSLDELKEKIPQLLDGINVSKYTCILGLPLGLGSLRNIEMPFQDRKNIEQTLFFELEDLLVTPVDEQIIEYIITRVDEGVSHLLVAGIEKHHLGQCLDGLKTGGYVPEVASLRTIEYARQIIEYNETEEDFLVLDAELHSFNLAICHQGEVVLVRKISYHDQMVVDSPFQYEDSALTVRDFQGAKHCLTEICSSVEHSISYFKQKSGLHIQPHKIFITGRLSQSDFFRNIVAREFPFEIINSDLQKAANMFISSEVTDDCQAAFYDHAVALALSGFKKRGKVNFLKGEFAGKGFVVRARKILVLVAALVFVLAGGVASSFMVESNRLQKRYDQYLQEMVSLYRESFPNDSKIYDPLKQMTINMLELQKNSGSAPVFTEEKRTLDILADISQRIPASLSIHVGQLTIDRESVRLKGTTDTFNNVNVIQKFLRNSPRYDDVDIVSAAAEKEGDKIRFEIRLKIREML